MTEKTKRRCYWCDRLTTRAKRVTLAGPAKRRVYECAQCRGLAENERRFAR